MKWARWYELGATGLREVLSLPAEGGEAIFTDQYLFREFDSKVVNRADNTGTETIQVKFTAQYSGSGALIDETRQIPLFTRSQTAIYSRTRGESAFLLDPMRSDVGEEEIRTVYNLGITCENFLAFNLNDVVKIASAGNKTLKEWFRRYIGTCRPSADRTRALEALTH
jgi:hypothetical protein